MNSDFLIERTLNNNNKEYHQLVANTSFTLLFALEQYKNYFPEYTDHTIAHSLNVLDFCNKLVGTENIDKLNDDELYVLYMAAYLHDSGMGVSENDFEIFKNKVMTKEYIESHPNASKKDIIRAFHHELSSEFVYKYANLFEIPSKEHTFAISAVSRGHRITELLDEKQYPSNLLLSNGNTVDTVYLAVLIRLADELDIASDRIFAFDYPENNNMHILAHRAIKKLEITDDAFIYHVKYENEENKQFVIETIGKVKKTLNDCLYVIDKKCNKKIKQQRVEIKEIVE